MAGCTTTSQRKGLCYKRAAVQANVCLAAAPPNGREACGIPAQRTAAKGTAHTCRKMRGMFWPTDA